MYLARTLVAIAPQMTFVHVSGRSTDASEKSRVMWARVKGKAENAIAALPFANVYNVRPGFMKPSPGQKHVKTAFKIIAGAAPLLRPLFGSAMRTLRQVALAMIALATVGSVKKTLEVADLNALADARA